MEFFRFAGRVREHLEGKGEALEEVGNTVIRPGKKQEVESHYFQHFRCWGSQCWGSKIYLQRILEYFDFRNE